MTRPIRFNEYEIDGNVTRIKLKYKNDVLWAIIDTEDLQRLIDFQYHWCARYRRHIKDFYVQCNTYFNGIHKTIALHQFVLNYFEKSGIDHINNQTLDNRKENLRIANARQNHWNRKSKNVTNTTGYRNVIFQNGKYIVKIQIDGKQTTMGKFDDLDEAGAFAEEMRQKYYGEWSGKN